MPGKAKTSYAKQIEALKEISTAISSDRYIDDVLKLTVTVTANVMDSKVCSLWLIDEKEECLKVRATQTMNKEYLKERSLKLGEGVVGYVAQQNEPAIILDVLEEPRVINIYKSPRHEFTKTELDLLTTVANQAAICIENTELMVRSKVIKEELESRKLVERAKGILMREYGLLEDEAFGRIRKKSMDSRRSMRDIAEAIILAHEMKK